MEYTRIYGDSDGESHFEDVTVELSPVDFAPPAPPLNLAPPIAADRVVLGAAERAWFGDWHPTPNRQFFFQMSGKLEVAASDGEVRQFQAGSLLLLEDVSGKGHLSKVVGNKAVHGVFVQLRESGDAAA